VYLSLFPGENGGLCLGRFESLSGGSGGETEDALTDSFVNLEVSTLHLKLTVREEADCRLSYSLDGKNYTGLGPSFRLKEGQGAWVGAKFGLFAAAGSSGNSVGDTGYADFASFRFR
jgi:hypothetical protein